MGLPEISRVTWQVLLPMQVHMAAAGLICQTSEAPINAKKSGYVSHISIFRKWYSHNVFSEDKTWNDRISLGHLYITFSTVIQANGPLETILWKGRNLSTLKYNSHSQGLYHYRFFLITIQIQWKFHFALISILTNSSLQNFAYDMTVVLSWHVQNFVVIWWQLTELQQGKFSIKSSL